jgi:nitroimidazol reductase NimA-like FMN-containing flavoprotein (pyridoxamine 5'-phosphate oxidase superfamily)
MKYQGPKKKTEIKNISHLKQSEMLGKLDAAEIENLLARQVLGRIACHADDRTYIVPISYVYDGTYVYAHAKEGMKINMMRKNPKVCFEVDEMKDMANWKSVVAWGEYEELIQKKERNDALKKLVDRILPIVSSETTHLSPHWPFPSDDMSNMKGIVFQIKLNEKTGRFENNPSTSLIA